MLVAVRIRQEMADTDMPLIWMALPAVRTRAGGKAMRQTCGDGPQISGSALAIRDY